MRLYEVTASCLVDDIVLHWYVKAKNICLACGRAYVNLIKNPVVDIGSFDVVRVKDTDELHDYPFLK